MNSYTARPKWWQIYLIVPLLIVLFLLDARLKLSVRGHQIVQLGILAFIYWLVHVWLNVNAAALSNVNRRGIHGTVIIMRAPLHTLVDTNSSTDPMFQLPDPEIKGVLSDTFEMDTIDLESFTAEQAEQKLNKE